MLLSEPIRVDVPHKEGQWFELRPLSWKKVKEARKALSREQLDDAKSVGAELISAFQGSKEDQKAAREALREQQKEQEYDISKFDTGIVLEYGIAKWSYEEPVNLEAIEQIEEKTAIWAKQQIIDMTKAPSEEERKNSLPDSTTP